MADGVRGVIEDCHAVSLWLLDRLVSGAEDARPVFLRELRRVLGGYLLALEELVIPALKSHRWAGITSDALVAHFTLKRCFANLLVSPDDSPELAALLLELSSALSAQKVVEESHWIPALDRLLTEGERQSLGLALHGRIWLHQPPGAATWPDSKHPQDLLHDARVVLGTWGAERSGDRST